MAGEDEGQQLVADLAVGQGRTVVAAGAVISALLIPNGKLPVTEGDEAPAMAH